MLVFFDCTLCGLISRRYRKCSTVTAVWKSCGSLWFKDGMNSRRAQWMKRSNSCVTDHVLVFAHRLVISNISYQVAFFVALKITKMFAK